MTKPFKARAKAVKPKEYVPKKKLKMLELDSDFSSQKIRTKPHKDGIKCINTIIDSINTKDDINCNMAVRSLNTLKRLFLIDFEIEENNDRLFVKRWFEIEE